MQIPGTWAPLFKPDGTKDYEPNIFHIQDKDKLRTMVDNDPEAKGSLLKIFSELAFNGKLARTTEPGEIPVPNEQFIIRLVEDYNNAFNSYRPGFIEKRIKDRALDFLVALYRVDSAYFERIGGIISYLIAQHSTKFTDINGNYLNSIIDTHEWWNESDYRERSRGWIDWGFRFIENKYKTDPFYKKSINHVFLFINLNKQNWAFDKRYNPEFWFPYGRGMECNMLHGGNY